MKRILILSSIVFVLAAIFFTNNKSIAYIRSERNEVENTVEEKAKTSEKKKTKGIVRSVVIGAIVSTIICFFIGLSHKPVKIARQANDYVERETIRITGRRDQFYDSVVNKTPKSNR